MRVAYRPPVNDYRFLFRRILEFAELTKPGPYENLDADEIDAVLEAAAAIAANEIAPLQRSGDMHPAELKNGVVHTSPGFDTAYSAVAEGGWIGMSARPEYGGSGFPVSLRNAFNEMANGACMAFGLNPMLTQSQIEALERHGSEWLKELCLPRLTSGKWCGTMNITEPQAGTDVGAIRTKAEPESDSCFRLTGQKIFISWADSDFVENVCHLVLARLPDAPPGSKGLSLFLAPKFLPDDAGRPGRRNSIRIESLEHKLGIHGSPTAVVLFERAKAWIVGEPNGGLAAMFTMMNSARLGVGVQGVGVADAAWQKAHDFAHERRQGRPQSSAGGTIVGHANVRRALAIMKAQIFAARSICAFCGFALDMARVTGATAWSDRAALLTPIAKVYGSDTGVEVSTQAMQLHGGAGYIEATGASQHLRDALVATIYEGTNDVQSLDLVGRKLDDGGTAVFGLLDEIRSSAERSGDRELADLVLNAESEFRATSQWMVKQPSLDDRAAGAAAYLRSLALLIGAHAHLSGAAADSERRPLAVLFMQRLLPAYAALCGEARCGADIVAAVRL